MKYLIKTTGDVVCRQEKAYLIDAKNEEQAITNASDRFANEFGTTYDLSFNTQKRTGKAIGAFLLMTVAIFLSFISWKDGHGEITFAPALKNLMYATVLYGVYVVRFKGVVNICSSWMDVCQAVFTTLLLSTFVQMILCTTEISLFFTTIHINSDYILLGAIVLYICGVKIVSLICLLFTIVLALIKITALSQATGIWGVIYFMSALLGLIYSLSIEPLGNFNVRKLSADWKSGVSYIKNDCIEAGNQLKEIKRIYNKKDIRRISLNRPIEIEGEE